MAARAYGRGRIRRPARAADSREYAACSGAPGYETALPGFPAVGVSHAKIFCRGHVPVSLPGTLTNRQIREPPPQSIPVIKCTGGHFPRRENACPPPRGVVYWLYPAARTRRHIPGGHLNETVPADLRGRTDLLLCLFVFRRLCAF